MRRSKRKTIKTRAGELGRLDCRRLGKDARRRGESLALRPLAAPALTLYTCARHTNEREAL